MPGRGAVDIQGQTTNNPFTADCPDIQGQTTNNPLTADGPRTDVADLTTYSYYPADDPDLGKRGNLATVTSALGHLTQVTAYDAHGRAPAIVDPNGVTTSLTYDLRGRLTARSVGGETTAYEYQPWGGLKRITLPDGAYLAYSHDAAAKGARLELFLPWA